MNHQWEKEALIRWSGGQEREFIAPGELFDWDWLLGQAEIHRIDLLLAHNILENGGGRGEGIALQARERLAGWLEEGENFEELRFSRSEALLKALDKQGVRCVILKGPALAAYFPRPGLRRYKDLDIFIAEEDLAKANAALRTIGYAPWREEAVWPDADSFTYHWPPFWNPADELFNIEIHDPRHHSGGFLGLIDAGEWLELAEPAVWRGREFMALPRELSLLYVCTHAHRHQFMLGGPRRLKNALDLYRLIEAGIDWEKFLSHFRRYFAAQEKVVGWWERELAGRGLSQGEKGSPLFDWADLAAHVHYGLSLAKAVYGAIVPERVLTATFPREGRLLEVGLIYTEAEKEILLLWNIPLGERYLEHGVTPVEELRERGILKFWRQLPPWTSFDDIYHLEPWQEICRQAPRIRPERES